MPTAPQKILSIAGVDPSGGAGIAADLKTIHANGGYGLLTVVAVTAQNTRAVDSACQLPADIIRAQIEAVFADFEVAAVKTGMLASATVVDVVAEALANHRARSVVIDPVLVSTSGFPLLDERGAERLRTRLLPLARVCTPNRHEAEILSGITIRGLDDAEVAARRILKLGPQAVLITGGHLAGPRAVDLLLDGPEIHRYESARVGAAGTHGTGCVLAAAIATWLGRGLDLPTAVGRAKEFVARAIEGGLPVGKGPPVADPFFCMPQRDWRDSSAHAEREAHSGGTDDATGR